MSTCILVADSAAARIYLADSGLQQLDLLEELTNPDSRQSRSELNSDRPGQQRNDSGGAHGLGGDADPHIESNERFARTLGHRLHLLRHAGRFTELHIAAAPHFLGLLRRHLHQDCQAVLRRSIDKDLMREDTASLVARLTRSDQN